MLAFIRRQDVEPEMHLSIGDDDLGRGKGEQANGEKSKQGRKAILAPKGCCHFAATGPTAVIAKRFHGCHVAHC